ncbi:MAG TPA: hypothetical protein VKF83_03795 [Stellaceae bacterium]|nr:hypothetical protein [Stellaceae bacterium]
MSPSDVLSWTGPIALWVILFFFDITTIKVLRDCVSFASISDALKEKSNSVVSHGEPSVPPGSVAIPSAIPAIAPASLPGTAEGGQTSYSRLAGLIGAIVLTTFFWALANIVIVKAFTAPDEISKILSSLGPLILAGSALFAPYAFNQLGQMFKIKA